jgi:UPF0755 protein
VFEKLDEEEYINSLIEKYSFITNEIKNDEIYYSLEGYLYPDTYEFSNKDISIESIFEKMLDNMVLKLKDKNISNKEYSFHELLTLASIVEMEAGLADREDVAGVFYNRLELNIALGSDVTTYYASKIDLSDRDLYQSELDEVNGYNTRSSQMTGLPVGPICNPSIESIDAVLNPNSHDYIFFVADKYGETYMTKTYSEHLAIQAKLKDEGLWYEYD